MHKVIPHAYIEEVNQDITSAAWLENHMADILADLAAKGVELEKVDVSNHRLLYKRVEPIEDRILISVPAGKFREVDQD